MPTEERAAPREKSRNLSAKAAHIVTGSTFSPTLGAVENGPTCMLTITIAMLLHTAA